MILSRAILAFIVGRAVASETRGPQFEFGHWPISVFKIYLLLVVAQKRQKYREKEAANGHFWKTKEKKKSFSARPLAYLLSCVGPIQYLPSKLSKLFYAQGTV